MPFTPKHNRVYNRVIEPICEDLGYEVNKADSTDAQQNILRDVISGIYNVDLLIADMTDSNPNVFYEAGVADGLGIPTILITQSIDGIPFDLQRYNMIEYSTDITEIEEFESDLRDIGQKHLNGEIEFGSPVSDFTDVSISTPTTSETEDVETDETAIANEQSSEAERGIMDYAAEAETEQSNFVNSVSEITEKTDTLQQRITEHVERINAIADLQDDVSPTRANRLARRAANDIREYADSISGDTESVEESLEVMMDAEDSFINFADADKDDHREALKERQEGLRQFRTNAEDAIEGLEAFYYETTQLKGINRAY